MDPMVLARAVHMAAVVLLAGAWTFGVLIAAPAAAAAARQRIDTLAWIGLGLGLASGLVWLLFQASGMSGQSPEEVLSSGAALTVLTHTRFGAVWEFRGLCGALLAGLMLLRRGRQFLDLLALGLSLALLGSLAWAGHAGSDDYPLHLLADFVHLLAAGAWLGALVPLALFLGETRDRESVVATVRRFSTLGILAVGALLVTGIVNGWLLVRTVPALVGTDYGRLLIVKVFLFLAMVGVACVNRLRLTPALAEADWRLAARWLRRNAVVETLLGLAILAVVGVLGTLPPGAHEQLLWPFPARISFEAVNALPDLRTEAIGWTVEAVIGIGMIGVGCWRRGWWRCLIPAGIVLAFGAGWTLLPLVTAEAYPTSFYASTQPFTTASLRRGEAVFEANCTSCHGPDGRGDGPAAKGLRVPPADLTADHLFDHSDGDLFWWIGEGMSEGAMPGFADTISEEDRWNLINFVHARASGVLASDMTAEVTAFPAPYAPDFSFEAGGRETTLLLEAAKGGLLLAFAEDKIRIEAPGRLDVTVPANSEIRAAYRLFERRARSAPLPQPAETIEFLIDRTGAIRARWSPGDTPDWRNSGTVAEQMRRMEAMPLAPRARSGHVH